jgi:hypothetical protein
MAEAVDGPLQGVAQGAADEQQIDDRIARLKPVLKG